jgi:hypothetical protein
MKEINLEKAVEDFCSEYGLCPTKTERLLLELAINRGRAIQIECDIAKLNEKLGEFTNDKE